MAGKVFIGTSGWHYKHWRELFYPKKLPAKEMLAFYAQHFETVEVNNTFYNLPLPSTFNSWRENSPAKFLFAVKGSRFITHMKKLKDPVPSSQKFFAGVERLERKLGPILFQLPPRWNVNIERLTLFLEALPEGHQYVLEIRDESWLVREVYDVLRMYNTAFCIHDLARMQTPLEITAELYLPSLSWTRRRQISRLVFASGFAGVGRKDNRLAGKRIRGLCLFQQRRRRPRPAQCNDFEGVGRTLNSPGNAPSSELSGSTGS